MLTRWGRDLDPDRPLPEHPRPQLQRSDDSWSSLNGRWRCAFTASPERPARWDQEIVVPFSPEAALSGVGRQLQPDEWLWYRLEGARAPEPPPGGRVLLHFGAVDQSCVVWVNGIEVGGHVGGYLPFTLDVTGAMREGAQVLEVRVRDLSETGYHARGKQRLDRGAIWYTAQSGIWQTVWWEAVPAAHIESLALAPAITGATAELGVTVAVAGRESGVDARVTLIDGEREIATAAGPPGAPLTLAVSEPRLWSPEDPHLYDLRVDYGADRVRSYAALREHGIEADQRGRRWFTLNGERIAHVGVLDQGYWPDGLLTAPSDAAMAADIAAMRELGFNTLRKHVKIEPLRWYYHCDRLGMLVWQDLVNGGGRYRHLIADLPARYPIRISDRRHDVYFRGDPQGRAEFREEARRAVALLRNVAAIAVWTPFNEGWGQFDANEIAAEIAALDPARLVNHASGWIDQGGGDIKSRHCYFRRYRLRRRPWERRLQALAEYGGYSLPIPGHADPAAEFGYRRFNAPADLERAFTALHREQIEPAVRRGLAATIYTQLSDVEDELNGLLTWDREVLKIPAEAIRAVTGALRAAIERG